MKLSLSPKLVKGLGLEAEAAKGPIDGQTFHDAFEAMLAKPKRSAAAAVSDDDAIYASLYPARTGQPAPLTAEDQAIYDAVFPANEASPLSADDELLYASLFPDE